MSLRYDLAFVLILLNLVLGSTQISASENTLEKLKKVVALQQATIESMKHRLFTIGSIQISALSETQFQKMMGSDDWVLMNGQEVKGSKYAKLTNKTTVPNATGRFLRMSGGKAGPLLEPQDYSTAKPKKAFKTSSSGNHSHTMSKVYKDKSTGGTKVKRGADWNVDMWANHKTSSAGNHSHSITGGDDETRPVNIAVNYFIKVN